MSETLSTSKFPSEPKRKPKEKHSKQVTSQHGSLKPDVPTSGEESELQGGEGLDATNISSEQDSTAYSEHFSYPTDADQERQSQTSNKRKGKRSVTTDDDSDQEDDNSANPIRRKVETVEFDEPVASFLKSRVKLPLPPGSLKVFNGDRVMEWLEDVDDVVFRACELDEDDWLRMLPVYLAGPAKDLFRRELKMESWPTIRQALLDIFHSNATKTRILHELEGTRQKEDELVADFCNRIRGLAYSVDPGMPDRYLRGYIKKGLKDVRLQLEFTRNSQKELRTLIEELSMMESAFQEIEILQATSNTITAQPVKPIFQVEAPRFTAPQEPRDDRLMTISQLRRQSPKFCHRCQTKSHSADECHKLVTCHGCKKKGHVAAQCWTLHPEKRPEFQRQREGSYLPSNGYSWHGASFDTNHHNSQGQTPPRQVRVEREWGQPPLTPGQQHQSQQQP